MEMGAQPAFLRKSTYSLNPKLSKRTDICAGYHGSADPSRPPSGVRVLSNHSLSL